MSTDTGKEQARKAPSADTRTDQDGAAGFLKPIVTQTRDLAVLDALASMIGQAGLKVGDKIPSETLIAQRLQVGRSTIREALKGWESLGIIHRKRGAGTYLSAEVSANTLHVPFTLQLEGVALLRTIQVRRVLEVASVRGAAVHATDAQRKYIRQTYNELASTLDAKLPWRAADETFHLAIHTSSGNPLFGQLIRQLDAAFYRTYVAPFGREEIGMLSFEIHGDLCDAVVNGDADRAVEVIERILDIVEDDVKRAIK